MYLFHIDILKICVHGLKKNMLQLKAQCAVPVCADATETAEQRRERAEKKQHSRINISAKREIIIGYSSTLKEKKLSKDQDQGSEMNTHAKMQVGIRVNPVLHCGDQYTANIH